MFRAVFFLLTWIVSSLAFAQTFSLSATTSTTGSYTITYSASGVYGLIDEWDGTQYRTIGGGSKSGTITVNKTVSGTYTYRMQNCPQTGPSSPVCSVVSGTKSITVTIAPAAPVISVSGIENIASNIDTNGTFTLSWNLVANADNYALEQNGNTIYYGPGSSYNIQSLGFGSYQFRVRACRDNATVCTYSSNTLSITIQYPQPTLPSGPTFSGLENAAANTDSNGTFTISWGESVGAEAYLLKRNGQDWYWGSNRTFTESGVQPGAYTYQVKGCRDSATNCSAYTTSITITVASPAPSSSSRSSSSIAITSTSTSRSSSSVAITSTSASRSSSSVAITSTSTSRSSSSAPLISSSSSSRSSSSVSVQPKTTRYTYDALGRLTFVEDAQNGNRDYDYDAAGNRLLVSTAVTSDTTAEPNVLLPAPSNLYKSLIYSCAWKATWNPVTGAAKYLVKDSSGASQTVTTAEAVVACPVGNSSGNMPQSVQACTANNVCGTKAYF